MSLFRRIKNANIDSRKDISKRAAILSVTRPTHIFNISVTKGKKHAKQKEKYQHSISELEATLQQLQDNSNKNGLYPADLFWTFKRKYFYIFRTFLSISFSVGTYIVDTIMDTPVDINEEDLKRK